MNLLVGALSVGLLLSLLTLGVFLTYRVLNRLDLTTDGSFGLGAAVAAALLARGVHPVTATLVATGPLTNVALLLARAPPPRRGSCTPPSGWTRCSGAFW